MDLLFYLFRRLLPLGLIAGAGLFMFTSFAPVSSDRVEALGLDASAFTSPSVDASLSSLSVIPEKPPLLVRVTLNWSAIELSEGNYNWAENNGLDLQITTLSSQRRKIIGVLEGGPTYLVSAVDRPVDQTQLLLRWAAFVQAAVDRYGEQINAWEIGSRINTTAGIAPFLYPQNDRAVVKPDPILYAKLVKTASGVIKNADPNDEVWTGSLVGFTSSACAMNPLTFLLELNGAKAWKSLDGIEFEPDRGAAMPEAQAVINPDCASSLAGADSTLSGETRALQELIRQLGGKSLRVSGLGWSQDQLAIGLSSRGLSAGQLQADLLTRAAVPLFAQNGVASVLWRFDPAATPEASQALINLDQLLVGSQAIGQVQGEGGSVNEYRFKKGNQLIIVVWRSIDGDTPAPVNLSNLAVNSLSAFPVDAASLSKENGTAIPVDKDGNALILVNERPVLLIGTTADWSVGIQQNVQNTVELGQIEIKQGLRALANNQKAALMHWIDGLLSSAKDQAITWGEDKINELLN